MRPELYLEQFGKKPRVEAHLTLKFSHPRERQDLEIVLESVDSHGSPGIGWRWSGDVLEVDLVCNPSIQNHVNDFETTAKVLLGSKPEPVSNRLSNL